MWVCAPDSDGRRLSGVHDRATCVQASTHIRGSASSTASSKTRAELTRGWQFGPIWCPLSRDTCAPCTHNPLACDCCVYERRALSLTVSALCRAWFTGAPQPVPALLINKLACRPTGGRGPRGPAGPLGRAGPGQTRGMSVSGRVSAPVRNVRRNFPHLARPATVSITTREARVV